MTIGRITTTTAIWEIPQNRMSERPKPTEMRFVPIEGEFFLVEMQSTPDDPDYVGPFATEDEARQWGGSEGETWSDFVVTTVWSRHPIGRQYRPGG